MEIYELRHTYEGADNWFEIGFFTSPEAAHAAADMLMQAPGFRDHPEGFLLVPRNVQTELSLWIESMWPLFMIAPANTPEETIRSILHI